MMIKKKTKIIRERKERKIQWDHMEEVRRSKPPSVTRMRSKINLQTTPMKIKT